MRTGFMWGMFLGLLGLPAAAVAQADSAGVAVLTRMHDRYANAWYQTLTFTQKTTTFDSAGAPHFETWYESVARVDGREVLRIDRGQPSTGNGVMYSADSVWIIRKGVLAAARANGNDFIPLIQGVYVQPLSQTVRELRSAGFDLSRTRRGMWKSAAVTIVGASDASDSTSAQFWIDDAKNVLVRMVLRAPGSGGTLDVHLDGYVKAGGGWLATRVDLYDAGTLRQREEYSAWRANRPLSPELFDPAKWLAAEHWVR